MLAAPLESWLLGKFFRAPDFLGKTVENMRVTEAGTRLAQLADGSWKEV